MSERYPTFADVEAGARIGTSSLRRRGQLLAMRGDITVTDINPDMLAVGMEPSVPKDAFPVDVVVNDNGFIEADEKNGGIFAAGCSSDALDVNRAVQSATASALRAIQVVNRVAGTEG